MDQELEEHLKIKLSKKRNELRNTIKDLSSASKLIHKKSMLLQVNDELDNKREEFEQNMERLKQRRNIFENKERKLKESLKIFDKFVKDNDLKKHKASLMIETNKQWLSNKELELEKLKNDKDLLTVQKKKIIKQLTKYSKLRSYLAVVVNTCDDFIDLREVVNKFNHLEITKLKVLENYQINENEIMNIKNCLHQYKENQDSNILTLNTKLSELKIKHEIILKDFSSKEKNFHFLCKQADDVSLEFEQIKLFVKNLHNKVNDHRRITSPSTDSSDVEGQMMKVKHYLDDLISLLQERVNK